MIEAWTPVAAGFRCAWSVHAPSVSAVDAPPLLPVQPTSPGRVDCGTTTCTARTEMCVIGPDQVGQCIPHGNAATDHATLASQALPYAQRMAVRACDEAADCPPGQGCCEVYESPTDITLRQCQRYPCLEGELCLPGGACRPGFRCDVVPGARTGTCTQQNPGAQCGSQRCSGDTPVCCWNATSQTGYCTGPWDKCREPSETRLACAESRDCGGSPCLRYLYGGYQCTGKHWTESVCTRLADCLPRYSHQRPKRCEHTPDLPPGVKKCIYD